MSASTPYHQPPYIFGEFLYASENELPGFGSFLWQGATVGVLLTFLWPVAGLLSVSPYFGYLFVNALPWALAAGIGFGVLEGIMIWACTYLTGHQLNALVRAVIGVVVLALLLIAFDFVFAEPSPYDKEVPATKYLVIIGIYSACGVIFGLVIGSRFDPLQELIRGTTPPRWSVLAALTGFVLRVSSIYFLMFSVLVLIWMVKVSASRTPFTFGVIAVSILTTAVVILFARMPFWLLLPLAIIVNFPIAVLVTDVLTEDESKFRALTLVYLHLWAAFLFCRVSVPKKPRFLIKKELRWAPDR